MITSVPYFKASLVEPVLETLPLDCLDGWVLKSDFSLSHKTNRFFTTIGYSNIDSGKSIILYDQNEIGFLFIAILPSNINPLDSIVFPNLKFEPGNNPYYQLSPTVQKTYSNFTAVHGGSPFSLSAFDPYITQNIYMLLHTEQSNSFLHKKNLNSVSYVDESFHELSHATNLESFTLRELFAISLIDCCVHIDLRSCLCPYLLIIYFDIHDIPSEPTSYYSIHSIINRLSYAGIKLQNTWRFRSICHFAEYDGSCLNTIEGSSFINQKVLGISVHTQGREVSSWQQPLIQYPVHYFDLLYCINGDSISVLVSVNIGPGARNEPELFPSYISQNPNNRISDYLTDIALVHSSFQSEEGGRFYHRKNLHSLFSSNTASVNLPLPDGHNVFWIDVRDLHHLLVTSHYCSIELRSPLYLLFSYLFTL